MKPVLIDTGVIVAILDRSEKQHSTCIETVHRVAAPLVTCEAVITESCYLLRGLRGASEAVMQNVVAGIFQIPFQVSSSANEVRRILKKYQDRRIDMADACLIHMAQEYDTSDILTLDSDFHFYRWGKNKPFRIMPQS
jgi:predicted nucleic acid-binding protein